ncbi:hypothetical protein AVEN_267958-1, partial [Araneus ventricosus]
DWFSANGQVPYFHIEPTVNHGEGANQPRTINHHLSIAHGGGGLWKYSGIRLGLQL